MPLIVCIPGKGDDGKVSEALVNEGIDLMPSLCSWTGAVMPEGRSGVSLRPVVEAVARDKAVPERPYIVTETNFIQTSGTLGWMVRSTKYKYVLYDKGKYREQLYDMENDRGEMRNLAVESEYAEILRQHREMLREWLLTHPATPAPSKHAPKGLAEQATDRKRHLRMIP